MPAHPSTDQTNFLTVLAEGMPPGLHLLVAQKIMGKAGIPVFPAEEWREQYLKGSWYFSTGASDSKKLRRAANIKAVRAIVIDDVGPKVDPAKIHARPTWMLETSPGNQQWGFLLKGWSADIHGADELFAGLIAAGLQDPGVRTACRLFRIPGSLNDKPGMDGYTAVLHHFDRDTVYTLKTLAKALRVKPGKLAPRRVVDPNLRPGAGQPCPIFDWLHGRGEVVREATGGWFDVRCPWEHEHSADRPDGCRLLPSWNSPTGIPGVMCEHGHGGIGHPAFRRNYIQWVRDQGGPEWPVASTKVMEDYQQMLKQLLPPESGVTLPSTRHDDPDEPKDLYDFITLREALGLIELKDLPNVEIALSTGLPRQVQPTCFENIEAGLRQLGIQPRLNLMDASVDFVLPPRLDPARFGHMVGYEIASMVEASLFDVFGRARMKAKKEITDCIARIANKHHWHPMKDWMLSRPWDGRDRLEDLLGTVQTPTPDLWRTYFRRWALQTVEAACGWSKGRRTQKGLVLVLVGKQRIGKTRWLMALAPGFTKSGKHLNLNGSNARDSIHQVLQGAITELGELDATFRKSDISALKAFITEILDEYRLPYAPIWLKRPRCTSFCGSVNEPRFLNDPTGSGRFLGIEVIGHLQVDHAIDMQQFWAQMHTYWAADEQYWLTPEEEKRRDEHADGFQAIDAVGELVEESLEQRKDEDVYTVRAIVGPRAMLDLCKADSILAKNLSTASRVLLAVLGKGRDLTRQGAVTRKPRWVVNVTGSEQTSHKLTVAKPASA